MLSKVLKFYNCLYQNPFAQEPSVSHVSLGDSGGWTTRSALPQDPMTRQEDSNG